MKHTLQNYKPLGNRVLVKVLEQETKTASGIIIPDTAKEKQVKGEIIKVGTGCEDPDVIDGKGKHVTFSQYGGIDVKFDGEDKDADYKVFRETDFSGLFDISNE